MPHVKVTFKLCFPSDNNECATEINLCGAKGICQNTPGSFVCECQRGFSLDQTGLSCEGRYNTFNLISSYFPSSSFILLLSKEGHTE